MKIPVQALWDYCEKMLQEEWGYIWGAAGILWTAERQKAASNDMAVKYGSKWIGHYVVDCSGVMVYIWKRYGLSIPHGSNSIARKCVGKMGTRPQPGYAAFIWKPDDTDKYPDGKGNYSHIGIVAKDGETVYEARGTINGFVTSPVSRWDYFAPFNDVDYEGSVEPLPDDGERVFYRAKVTTKGGKLNVRSGPSTDFDVIHQLPNGTVVDVMFVYADKGWAFIDDDGDQGYASMSYLAPVSPSEADKKADDETPAGDQTPQPDESQAKRRTILRNKDNNITIELGGEWDVYAVLGGD